MRRCRAAVQGLIHGYGRHIITIIHLNSLASAESLSVPRLVRPGPHVTPALVERAADDANASCCWHVHVSLMSEHLRACESGPHVTPALEHAADDAIAPCSRERSRARPSRRAACGRRTLRTRARAARAARSRGRVREHVKRRHRSERPAGTGSTGPMGRGLLACMQ
jgi:hypothetical protein